MLDTTFIILTPRPCPNSWQLHPICMLDCHIVSLIQFGSFPIMQFTPKRNIRQSWKKYILCALKLSISYLTEESLSIGNLKGPLAKKGNCARHNIFWIPVLNLGLLLNLQPGLSGNSWDINVSVRQRQGV